MCTISLRFLCLCFMAVAGFIVNPAYAQHNQAKKKLGYYEVPQDPDIIIPEIMGLDVRLDNDDLPPQEPNIIVTKFLNIEPPQNLAERVARLVHGITVDIPPDYDYYGYEIRRYMQAVGNPKIYTDEAFLIEQIKNVRKADIIMRYWRDYLKGELLGLEKEIEAQNATSSVRTAYKQNSVAVRNFLSLSQSWIDRNKEFLGYVYSISEKYEFKYPSIVFKDEKIMMKFHRLLKARQNDVLELRGYAIFRLMVY